MPQALLNRSLDSSRVPHPRPQHGHMLLPSGRQEAPRVARQRRPGL